MGLTEITPNFIGKVVCSMEEYHKAFAVGSTSLRTLINQSPAHYLHNRENPTEPTPAQKLGTAIHLAALEPHTFKANTLVEPVFEGRTKKGEITTNPNATEVKDKRDKWYMENHGKHIVSQEQFDCVQGILNSLSKHKQASKLVAAGAAEESYFWKDPETGIFCKARPDFLREGHIMVDIKSTRDASYHSFQKDIAEHGYHVQAAMYLDGVSNVLGHHFDKFVIIAVEKEAPYAVQCFDLDANTIQEGRQQYYGALKILKECMKTGIYGGYPEELCPISLPSWAIKGDL